MRKITSILAATDLTESSNAVVRAAGEIAEATGAKLHLLHAFDLPEGTGLIETSSARPTFTDRVADAEAALEAQAEREVPAGVEVASRQVQIYVAHKAIADCADALDADLIVVGAHSRRRIGDDVLGGTADRVIRAARVPCLVVRGPLPRPLQRMVAPVDRSDVSRAALEVAIESATLLGPRTGTGTPARVTAIHVLPTALNVPEFGIDPEEIRGEIHQQVRDVTGRTPGAEAVQVREEVRWADSAVDEIVRYLGEVSADLAVIGTHGHGLLKRFLIGSVASGVARRAPCAVLLVPPSWSAED